MLVWPETGHNEQNRFPIVGNSPETGTAEGGASEQALSVIIVVIDTILAATALSSASR